MVCRGSPDPPRESYEENFAIGDSGNNIVINASSDSDDEELGHDGYQLLSTVSNEIPDDSESDEESDNETNEASVPEMPAAVGWGLQGGDLDLPSVEASVTEQVWAAPRETAGPPSIVMDTTQVDQVKAAMASFTLPSSAIPPWAATVPEEEWREKLLDRLKTLQTSSSSSSRI